MLAVAVPCTSGRPPPPVEHAYGATGLTVIGAFAHDPELTGRITRRIVWASDDGRVLRDAEVLIYAAG